MGYHFAYLLASYQSLKSLREVDVVEGSVLTEMIQRSRNIINLAIGTTDERTPHLTDHIYHVVTFSALTLCRLVHTYELELRGTGHDISALDGLVIKLVSWIKSIGLPCHVAPLLGRIVSAQFRKLRPEFRGSGDGTMYRAGDDHDHDLAASAVDLQYLPADTAFVYPDIIGSELFMGSEPCWPQWG